MVTKICFVINGPGRFWVPSAVGSNPIAATIA